MTTVTDLYDHTAIILGRRYRFIECYTCGMPVVMTRSQRRNYDENGESVYCVLGHQTVRRKSENKELQEKLKQAQDELAFVERANHNLGKELDVQTSKVAQFKKQVAKGQCAHCDQYFSDVHRHVKRMHPGKL